MSVARPFALLPAGAVLALTLAAPGTALADPGDGGGHSKGAGAESRSQSQPPGKGAQPAEQSPDAAEPQGEQASSDAPRQQAKRPAAESRPARSTPSAAKEKPARTPAGPPAAGPARSAPAAPARPAGDDAATTTDPAGNNGTIKVDTLPGGPARANRPHPGCAFVLQFFGFDAGQTADITFTGQAPTRSTGPLLSLDGQLISTTPADGTLEEGHSIPLTAADLGLVGTPTAAKGWHVKVAVDALEAPGGAKQKAFWLDCATGSAQVQEDATDAETADADADATDADAGSDATQVTAAHGSVVEGTDTGPTPAGDALEVLSETATRELGDVRAAAAGRGQGAAAVTAPAKHSGAAVTSTLASVLPFAVPAALPFTGAPGLAALLVAGVGAVAAGVAAQRAGRRADGR